MDFYTRADGSVDVTDSTESGTEFGIGHCATPPVTVPNWHCAYCGDVAVCRRQGRPRSASWRSPPPITLDTATRQPAASQHVARRSHAENLRSGARTPLLEPEASDPRSCGRRKRELLPIFGSIDPPCQSS